MTPESPRVLVTRELFNMLVNARPCEPPQPAAPSPEDINAPAYGSSGYLRVLAVPPCCRPERFNRQPMRPLTGYACDAYRAAGVALPSHEGVLTYEAGP